MEDGVTPLGIMVFEPVEGERPFWTYATNGMSERRMPCENEPHGDPEYRIELLAYSGSQAEWVVKLLQSMAVYPFEHRSGFALGHTIPVDAPQPRLWDGYLLAGPFLEDKEFNPLAIDIGIGEDWVFFLQVFGLLQPELDVGIAEGGPKLWKQFRDRWSNSELLMASMLDCKRKLLI
jgi:suppressor of fused protein SUFU